MTRADLVDRIAAEQQQLSARDVELAVSALLHCMSDALASGERVEIRGFGAFTLHPRRSYIGRNPKTGESVAVPTKHVPHFKPGKELRDRVDTTGG
jgi:integration host factor subunit beta